MPDSRTELIVLAVLAALNGAGKPGGVTVDRNRQQPLQKKDLPRISVYLLGEDVTRARPVRTCQVSDRKLRIAVVSRVAGTDEGLDPLRQWVISALLGDLSVQGLALEIDELSTDFQIDDDSKADYSVAATVFQIRYVTSRHDLTAQA